MASIVEPKNQPGHRWIQFTAPDGRRCTIRLGKVSNRIAEEHQTVVESVLACQLSGLPIEPRIAKFIGELDAVLRDRYERTGLIESRNPAPPPLPTTLGHFLDSFKKSKAMDVKDTSLTAISHSMKRLSEYFGKDTPLVEITPHRAREFRAWLSQTNKRDKKDPKPLALNTVRRRTGYCKEIFNQAVQDGIVPRNPFQGLTASVRSNKEREFYIKLDDFNKVLNAAPNARWRALLVLARVAALRVPSEVVKLKWDHIRFEEKRILVIDSSKNERHANRQIRKIPMLPLLEKHLLAWQVECEPGERVFPGIDSDTNLRTTFEKIILKAGVTPWPKLWQNLRTSGATDFARRSAAHVAAAICGHTVEIAKEHYWQVDDSDLDALIAIAPEAKPEAEMVGSSRKSSEIGIAENEKTLGNQRFPGSRMGEEGLEPGVATPQILWDFLSNLLGQKAPEVKPEVNHPATISAEHCTKLLSWLCEIITKSRLETDIQSVLSMDASLHESFKDLVAEIISMPASTSNTPSL